MWIGGTVGVAAMAAAAAAAAAPNVLIMLTDDQGWGDNQYNCDNSTGMCPWTPYARPRTLRCLESPPI